MYQQQFQLEDILSNVFKGNFLELNELVYLQSIDAISFLCKQKAKVKLNQLTSVLCKICHNMIKKDDYQQNQIFKLNCQCCFFCHHACLREQILQNKDKFESLEKVEQLLNECIQCDQGCASNLVNIQMIRQALSTKEVQMYQFEYFEAQQQKEKKYQQILELEKQNQVIEFQCAICLEEIDLNQNGYILKCGCKFCRSCLKDSIQNSLKENINLELENIFCPNGDCKKVLDFDDITFILQEDKEMIEKLEQKNIKSMFERMKRENPNSMEELIVCPGKYKIQKGSEKVIYIPKEQIEKQRQGSANIPLEDNEIIVDCNFTFIQDRSEKKLRHKCTKCKYEFCLNNCDSTHDGFSCENYQKWKMENNKDYRKELEAQGFKFCPNCSILTQRTGGCNRIICTNCKISYCYLCYFSAKTESEVYGHLNKVHGGYFTNA
ncbi:RING finger protein (macronuclear) [Tetrahymena thermophila SB210]|uniref:RING finger protein n=1 Tax=Tetrahymena thermophila (strain SB210) TaxID=312017 RepID=Q22X53_TETTS|nr:RING finger protein [Tetrahymena thermophila SB210]EAR89793.2 RING finger protein [Tetrahymena thermophila SB210]|eukprot:XP_001010038.2 RING finger protein [Tetrahymena thermophila SB210]